MPLTPRIRQPRPRDAFAAWAARSAAILLLLVLPAPAQSGPGRTQSGFSISGTVVSDTDGAPLQRATVELVAPRDGKVLQSSTSDELGRFSFPAQPRGSYVLRGKAPGFSSTEFHEHYGYSSAVVTGAGVDTTSLVLRLRPLGSIFGTITDESGDPVEHAAIQIFSRARQYGDARIAPTESASTDDLGRYNVAELVPGTYFVVVSARPWYAIYPRSGVLPVMNTGVVGNEDPAVNVAYPVTYFPGSTVAAGAQPIRIDGNQVQADVQLVALPALSLTFPRNPGRAPGPPPNLASRVFGNPELFPVQFSQTATSWVLNGIPAGDYLLRIGSSAQPERLLHLDRSGDAPSSPNSGSAHVHLQIDTATGTPPAGLTAALFRENATAPSASVPISPKGVDLHLGEGSYYINVTADDGKPLFPRNIRVNGKPVPDATLRLDAHSDLEVAFGVVPGDRTLRGKVQKDGQPCVGALVLLIPAEAHTDIRAVFRDQSNLDGSFEIGSVPPGPYLLLALEEPAWDTDWRQPEFLSRHLPRAVPVLIPANAPPAIDLPQPLSVQPL